MVRAKETIAQESLTTSNNFENEILSKCILLGLREGGRKVN